ncbi:hypothetical protein ACFZBU_45100 [Embleya sp. NPDC008237]|uniref:hypothetical protein n=1 Tax=Embleya sp. NPDC008237 TaxID=3363978 RepID=UPI0036E97805
MHEPTTIERRRTAAAAYARQGFHAVGKVLPEREARHVRDAAPKLADYGTEPPNRDDFHIWG